MEPINIRYSVRPVRRSLATGHVADLFGLSAEEPPHVVADGLSLDVRPGDLVLFTGPSRSGKSSLLREVGSRLPTVDAMAIDLPDRPLVDALPGPVEDRLTRLASCGLSEARLLLRTPAELSDGQRYRFRLAMAMAGEAGPSRFLIADEFAANLDRTLAKVLAFNLRKQLTRTGAGALLATTHEDLAADLRPDLHVRCRGTGEILAVRDERAREAHSISFAAELTCETGSRRDWPAFAKWHYRSHGLGFVRRVVRLRHGADLVGLCVFAAPAAALSLRSRFFGLNNPRSRIALQALNQQLWVLSRVVIHPTYRGAGIAARFIHEACRSCPVPWIETLTAMGQANPVFERAGFVRVGVIRKANRPGRYGDQFTAPISRPGVASKSRYSEPVYYVFDNSGRRADLLR